MARGKSTAREYFESLCVAVVLAAFVRTFVFQTFKIPSGSMEDALLVGDQLIVDKFGSRPIVRGQILVFKAPAEPETDLIKRVIGLPGETVEVRDRTVYIDGKALDEPYARFLFESSIVEQASVAGGDPRRRYGPVTIPAGQYFMMGDNRDGSSDSRYWGTVPEANLKGRAFFIWMSWNADALQPVWSRIGGIIR